MIDYIFKSERLGFRNWRKEDVAKMIALNNDPEVMRYFPAKITPEQTKVFIEKMKTEYDQNRYCYFAVDVLEYDSFIGFIGLLNQDYAASFTPCVDIGWRLDKKYWNFGYATEGAKACLRYAFETIKIKEIIATAPQINTESIRVMQKIGMKQSLVFKHPKLKQFPKLENCVLYTIATDPL
ncbi:N-acetyltransferase [Putridiphycobacter roseus]|uniref:N-acetyltransferase n=1 Tax=Putridiphycobacter roseus TaxID=2219161 RepID=A0A2W1NSB7_9FLAO|nr:GNAT family N-acetyltransferase [Putridiphycobacter roseus]PZE18542.1 N-acetyltransferase [Putridiphycobacter roseus]